MSETYTDQELRAGLIEVDESDGTVTSYEADFIEEVAYRRRRPLTQIQRRVAEEICKKYGVNL